MLKHIVLLVLLSTIIVLFMPQSQHALNLLLSAHDYVSKLLTDVFSAGQAGNIARGLIALLAIPLLLALIPTIVYWFARRNWFPYFMEIVWAVWLLQAGALIMVYKAAA